MVHVRSGPTRRSFLGVIGASIGLTAGCLGSADGEELSVGVIPDVDPETAIDRNVPLANHLEEELGTEIDLDTTSDYAGLVQATTGEHVDIAYFGGVSYVVASQRADVNAFAVGEKDGTTERPRNGPADHADAGVVHAVSMGVFDPGGDRTRIRRCRRTRVLPHDHDTAAPVSEVADRDRRRIRPRRGL
ncbi:PhnD/SsuA/transferrin family substrate-binding protein [Natrinema caseinilyticum]|uniref:PhnD/SsuA/transferrin family substrate-binding protein n=1 Tax=Natrinema caseinilyticum TaxID=2961570 RepID=UPI0020C2BC71|nr:PhnD/SsuA/transferrin family substrate-binding protein [Natrinema caseinilyticum]